MAKPPTGKIGHNSGQTLPDQKHYRTGLALYVRMDEEKKAMAQRHKRLKKRLIEGAGVAVEDVDRMFKMKDAPQSEVESWLKRQIHALGAVFGLRPQGDLFSGDPIVLDAIRFRGLNAGIEGKDGVPPPTLDTNEKKAWMEGWHDGIDARKGVITEMQKEFDEGGDDADHSEGALQTRAAAAVGAQAAADFAKDNPGVPDWSGYGTDSKKWTISQTATFVAWFSALPREADNLPICPDGLPLHIRTEFIDYRQRLLPKPADDGATLDGGVKGVGGDVVAVKPGDVKRLDLTPDDFGADSFEEIAAANYQGDANFDDYHLVVCRDGDRIKVLKDIVGAPPKDEGDDFEAPATELEAQKPRLAVVGAREEAEPEKPKPVRQKKAVDKESQSEKADRLRREAKVK